VDLLKGRDEKAYSYLYDHYSAALYGVVLRVLNSEEAARDVLIYCRMCL
jgi:RNA polymerase sigma-70 factor (ECF subfamily)